MALVTVKARFALKLTKTLTMNDLGKYWKPPATKSLSKAKVKKLKKKNKSKVQTKTDYPSYNEDWKQHWKSI